MTLFILTAIAIIFFLNNQQGLPSWGTLEEEDQETIKKNKYPSLTNAIIYQLKKAYPLQKHTIMAELRQIQKYNGMITNTVSYANKTHYELFKLDDKTIHTYTYITDLLNQRYGLNISKDVILSELKEYHPVILQAKQAINKLRPHQASVIFNIPIKHLTSYSANTPALPSGHSIQGMLFGALLYKHHRQFFDNNPSVLESVAIMCMDIGFRRVIAGLHFPSDHRAGLTFVTMVVNSWGGSYVTLIDTYNRIIKQQLT